MKFDRKFPLECARALVAALALVCVSTAAGATTIGYWRMESDLDGSPTGLVVANEIGGGSSLVSSEAFVDSLAVPVPTVPQTGAGNLGSLGPAIQGTPNGINATASWYAALDVSSITIELWARTPENFADIFSRTSGTDGVMLTAPNALEMTYYVDDGVGGSTAVVLSGLDDMDTDWTHYAFTYDAANGVGSFYVDGVLVASNDGPDGRSLFWGTAVDLSVGNILDYGSPAGAIDEFRIDDSALAPSQFLFAVPEPSTGVLIGLGLIVFGAARRRR